MLTLRLSSEQRQSLFNDTGLHVHKIGYDTKTKTWIPVNKDCKRCLLNDDLPGVTILSEGICNFCNEYENELKFGIYEESRVRTIIKEKITDGNPNCIVAYSGGKDSAAVLLTAIERYNLRPLAFLVDNGFIPPEVQKASQEFCDRLGVPLAIRTLELSKSAAADLQQQNPKMPCHSCIRGVFTLIAKECKERNLHLVVGGYRFPPLEFSLNMATGIPEHSNIVCVSPLLALRNSEEEQLEKIKRAGWHKINIAGNTSNCKLIGYIEEVLFDKIGYNPHIYEVSKEIRAGFYTREIGMKKISKPKLTHQHREDVELKLGLKKLQ